MERGRGMFFCPFPGHIVFSAEESECPQRQETNQPSPKRPQQEEREESERENQSRNCLLRYKNIPGTKYFDNITQQALCCYYIKAYQVLVCIIYTYHSGHKFKDRLVLIAVRKLSIYFRPPTKERWIRAGVRSFLSVRNPFSAAVPCWGQTTQNSSGLYPKLDRSFQRVNNGRTLRQVEVHHHFFLSCLRPLT